MKYDDLFIVDKNKIEKIIQEAKLEIDTTVIVSVNKIITKEFMIPINEDNVTETIDEQCCIPFLPYFYSNKSTVVRVIYPHEIRTKYQKKYDNREDQQVVMRNLLLFLQGLSLEDICMIAKYHNLYYKNNIFRRVLFTPSRIENARGLPEGQLLSNNVTLPLESPPEGGDLNRQRCKETLVSKHHFTLINWIYDHICIYLYNQNL
jgi:hypothetical protein